MLAVFPSFHVDLSKVLRRFSIAMSVEFVSLSTFVDAPFWNEINKRKLNQWKLDEFPVPVHGSVSVYDSTGCPSRVSLSHDSFGEQEGLHYNGQLIVTNTIENFKGLDRKGILLDSGKQIWESIVSGAWIQNPECLNTFMLTIFADLKRFEYTFWNCYPALCVPSNLAYVETPRPVDDQLYHQLLTYHRTHSCSSFVLIDGQLGHMSRLMELKQGQHFTVVVADPSTEPLIPGWPVRNVLAALSYTFSSLSEYSLISLRAGVPSIQYTIKGTSHTDPSTLPQCVGWERSEKGRLEWRHVNLRNQFDPVSLMEQSVNLNLSLIKWRLVPELRLDRFKNLRVLLLGAGTLGCNLARALMGWGVSNFTFVDNSNVSYSNPVRQSLAEFADAQASRGKAECAAEALKRIYPSVQAQAVRLTIPMPGHSVGEKDEKSAREAVDLLDQLVAANDVVFLALDSREARWLPTLLANKHNKMAFSVALGFDNFVVIRHGYGKGVEGGVGDMDSDSSLSVPYSELSCYFCSDVTAPGNSTADRTLDQQCTVSRAGLSFTASGLAVELLASVLQHEQPEMAFATLGDSGFSSEESSGLLGGAPHQIRGFVSMFKQITPTVRRFEKCVACGKAVREEFEKNGFELVKQVMNSPSTLERLTGLDTMEESVNDVDIEFHSDDASSVVSMS